MTHLRAVPTMFRLGFAQMVAWRAEMVIWFLTSTLPLVMLGLWNAVADGGPVAGLGQAELARYFVATLIVRQLTGSWLLWSLNYQIRTGALSAKLLKPVHPLWLEAITMVSAMPFRVIVLAPFVALLVVWRPELWATPSPASFALAVLSTAMAWALWFLFQAWFGMLAFWLEQSLGLFQGFFVAWMVFSGYVAPMATFPPWLRTVASVLPFRSMLAVPVELLGGFLAPVDALPDLAAQAGWLLVMFTLVALTWSRGLRRYGAYGA